MISLMTRSFHFFGKGITFFRRFGVGGIRLILAEKFSKKKLVSLKMKGYEHPVYLRLGTSDFATFMQMIFHEDYRIQYWDLNPKVILDCGANIGLGAVFFQRLFPGARIFAVEPEPDNFEILKLNVQGYPNITCVNSGVWNKKKLNHQA